jgi:hypothetical protein
LSPQRSLSPQCRLGTLRTSKLSQASALLAGGARRSLLSRDYVHAHTKARASSPPHPKATASSLPRPKALPRRSQPNGPPRTSVKTSEPAWAAVTRRAIQREGSAASLSAISNIAPTSPIQHRSASASSLAMVPTPLRRRPEAPQDTRVPK